MHAGTCLTVAASASAATFNESSVPGGDFANNFAGANLLPYLTTNVLGSVASDGDFFQFSNLVPGSPFTADSNILPLKNFCKFRLAVRWRTCNH